MKYGYARVSADDQNTGLQLAALKRAGCKKTFVDEGKSGATMSRPALKRCLKQLEHGDMLIVWKLDRLGRSVRDVVNTCTTSPIEAYSFKASPGRSTPRNRWAKPCCIWWHYSLNWNAG